VTLGFGHNEEGVKSYNQNLTPTLRGRQGFFPKTHNTLDTLEAVQKTATKSGLPVQ
jgi:hypothetical protein